MHRSLIRVIGTVALIGLAAFTCENKTATAPTPAPVATESSELDLLQKKLRKAETDLKWAKSDLEYAQAARDRANKREQEALEGQMQMAVLMFNPKAAKPFVDSLERDVSHWESSKGLVRMVHAAADETFASFGRQVVVGLIDTAMSYPSLAWRLYETAKPILLSSRALELMEADYGLHVLAPILNRRYDPYIGALAASQGHHCRWQLGAEQDKKTEACTKVIGKIGEHYGVPVTENLIEVLGVLNRRYAADTSTGNRGFNSLFLMAKDLREEVLKKF